MKYITLKEAATMSGYSSDYIGQLIRSGKLDGKQVFANVSWVTTEDAVREYLQKNKKGNAVESSFFERFGGKIASSEGLTNAYTIMSWITIAVFGLFIVLLISVISITIDHRVERSYMEKIQHVQ
jgi:hypothetical protein